MKVFNTAHLLRFPVLMTILLLVLLNIWGSLSYPIIATFIVLSLWVLLLIVHRTEEHLSLGLAIACFVPVVPVLLYGNLSLAQTLFSWGLIFLSLFSLKQAALMSTSNNSQTFHAPTELICDLQALHADFPILSKIVITLLGPLKSPLLKLKRAFLNLYNRYPLPLLWGIYIFLTTAQLSHHFFFFHRFFIERAAYFYWFYTGQYQAHFLLFSLVTLALATLITHITHRKPHIIVGATIGMLLIGMQVAFIATTDPLHLTPIIMKIESPYGGSSWKQVTALGKNFGDAQYNDAQVWLDNKPVRILKWEDDKIIFSVGPDQNKGMIKVRNVDYKESNQTYWEAAAL
ncbi:MAG TPA: hypothetical protein VD999_05310 [Vitreimonas sp.]|nr:hypothetical protein [Vitreimonas sp.]